MDAQDARRSVASDVAALGMARALRPRRFDQVIGQESATFALREMVARDHHSATLLITGPPGVGKTTLARLYASGMNCEEQSAGEPCGVCASCQRICAGDTHFSVLELDAATRRGIADARGIMDHARYYVRGWHVFIIDEAHQQTQYASTALLKTLEEPPTATSFVLLTTAPGSLEPAIRSRAIEFKLNPVSQKVIQEFLLQAVVDLGVPVDAGALTSIASHALGSVRKALNDLESHLLGGNSLADSGDVAFALQLLVSLAHSDYPAARQHLDRLMASQGPRGTVNVMSDTLDTILAGSSLDGLPPELESDWELLKTVPIRWIHDAQVELDRVVVPVGPEGRAVVRRRMASLMDRLTGSRRGQVLVHQDAKNEAHMQSDPDWWQEQTCPNPIDPSPKGDVVIGGMLIGPKSCDKPTCPACVSVVAERDLMSVKRSRPNVYLACSMPLTALGSADPRKRVRDRMKSAHHRLPGASWGWFAAQVGETLIVEAAVRVDREVKPDEDLGHLTEWFGAAFPKDTSVEVSALGAENLDRRFLRSLRDAPSLFLEEARARVEAHSRWNGRNVVQASDGFWLGQSGKPLDGPAKRQARRASRREVA